MIGAAAIAVFALVAAGVHSMLSRNVQRVVIGFLLLSNGTNLLVLAAGGLRPGAAVPVVSPGRAAAAPADPLPQAFVLTAIVIGLGLAAFLLAMASREHEQASREHEQAGREPEQAGRDGPGGAS